MIRRVAVPLLPRLIFGGFCLGSLNSGWLFAALGFSLTFAVALAAVVVAVAVCPAAAATGLLGRAPA